MARSNIKCDDATFERLKDYKRDDESWDDLLQAAAGLLAVARTDVAISDETEFADRREYDTVPVRVVEGELADGGGVCPGCGSEYVYVQELPAVEVEDYDIGCAGCGRARDSEPRDQTAEDLLGGEN